MRTSIHTAVNTYVIYMYTHVHRTPSANAYVRTHKKTLACPGQHAASRSSASRLCSSRGASADGAAANPRLDITWWRILPYPLLFVPLLLLSFCILPLLYFLCFSFVTTMACLAIEPSGREQMPNQATLMAWTWCMLHISGDDVCLCGILITRIRPFFRLYTNLCI